MVRLWQSPHERDSNEPYNVDGRSHVTLLLLSTCSTTLPSGWFQPPLPPIVRWRASTILRGRSSHQEVSRSMSTATTSSALGCCPVQALRIKACLRQITGPLIPSALPFVVSTRRGFSLTRRQ